MSDLLAAADLPERPNFLVDDPRPFWDRAPASGGERVVRMKDGILLLRFSDTRQAFADGRLLQANLTLLESLGDVDPAFIERRRHAILDMEGVDHVRLRRLAMPALSSSETSGYRPHARDVMAGLLYALDGQDRCEAVAALCKPYPIPVMCAALGVGGEDVAFFSRCADAWTRWIRKGVSEVPIAMAAHNEMDAYLVDILAKRRASPGKDLLSDLIRAEEEGERLNAEEIIHLVAALVVAGTDTTRFVLASALYLFAKHPDQWEQLAADPGLAQQAAEEVLRFAPVGALLRRVACEDMTIADVAVPKGTSVFLSPLVANRDPEIFDDPATFSIHRPKGRQNLTFAAGRKHCLGVHLARAEIQEALILLSRNLPGLMLDGEATWAEPLSFFQGPTSLPIRWRHP